MQDVDRVADVEPLAQPTRQRCARIDVESRRVVLRPDTVGSVCTDGRRSRNCR
jgi:hypothetical protein